MVTIPTVIVDLPQLDQNIQRFHQAAAAVERGTEVGVRIDLRHAPVDTVTVSTYDLPNHLGTPDRIASYVDCVFRAVQPGGVFAFDVATRKALLGINAIQVRETEESILLYRGALNEMAGYGFYRISGAVRAADGRYDRFETTITNWIVQLDQLDQLADILKRTGWRGAYVAAPTDLLTPLAGDPFAAAEQLPRVYFIARR
jgi:hypothetical protein